MDNGLAKSGRAAGRCRATNIQFSGNYAIKISWNDRHDTGLFTWEYLELLSNDLATAAAS